ncbi:hypothetical protein PSAC2689_100087 [Paraburkholderia sacchari]
MHPAALLENVTKHWFWSPLAAAVLLLGFSRNILALCSHRCAVTLVRELLLEESASRIWLAADALPLASRHLHVNRCIPLGG